MLTALLGRAAARGGRLPAGPVAGRRRARAARSARRSSTAPTTSASPARPRPASTIAKQCADRLIGCSLELGGKNPILVLRDADLDQAAEGAVRACFSNAGQLCVSTERMFVADQVYDRFVDRFVARAKAMTLGPGLDWGSDMGSLISPGSSSTPSPRTSRTPAPRARGCSPAAGPGPTSARTSTSRPSSRASRPDMTCFGNETFGPVVSLYRFHDEADAIARANDGEYGLNASIYSQDGARGRARRPADQVRHGQHQRGVRRDVRQHRRPDGRHARVRARPPPGRRGHPALHRDRSRWPPSGCCGSRRCSGCPTRRYAKVMTAQLRLLKKLGPRMSGPSTSTSWSSAPASAARSPRCG